MEIFMKLDITEIATKFDKAKPYGGNKLLCLCPWHEDRNQSLIVSIETKKNSGEEYVVAVCLAGCGNKDGKKKRISNRRLQELGLNLHLRQTIKYKKYKDDDGNTLVMPIDNELLDFHRPEDRPHLDWWVYHNVNGRTLGWVIRKEDEHGKHYYPKTVWRNPAGEYFSQSKWWQKPMPLYITAPYDIKTFNNDFLFIHEGEKAVEGGVSATYDEDGLLHTFKSSTHITWPKGTPNWSDADWSFVKSHEWQKIILMPDNDNAGIECMLHIAQHLLDEYGLKNIYMFDVAATGLPKKWDMGDLGSALTAKISPDDLEKMRMPFLEALNKSLEKPLDLQRSNDEWVYIEKGGVFWNDTQRTFYTREEYGLTMLKTGRHANPSQAVYDFVRNTNNTQTNQIIFAPQEKERVFSKNDTTYFNSYQPWDVDPIPCAETEIQWFIDHINYLCNGDELHSKQIIEYLAYIVQAPGRKLKWCLILLGKEGCGKSTIRKILEFIFGKAEENGYVKMLEKEDITDRFNSWKLSTLIAVVEEITFDADYDKSMNSVDKLKVLVTEETMTIEKKGIDKMTMPNPMNFILFSNKLKVFPIKKDARRWFIIKFNGDVKEPEYYKQLYTTINSGGALRVMYYLKHTVDLSNFNPDEAPAKTEAFHELSEETGTTRAFQYMTNKWDQSMPPFANTMHSALVCPAHLETYFAQSQKQHALTQNIIIDWIRHMGGKSVVQLYNWCGQRPVIWAMNDYEHYASIGQKVKEHYLEPRWEYGKCGWYDKEDVSLTQQALDMMIEKQINSANNEENNVATLNAIKKGK